MKSIRSKSSVMRLAAGALLAAAALTGGTLLSAGTGMSLVYAGDEAATPGAPSPEHHGWRHGGGRLFGQLGLSDAQKQQIKQIMKTAHADVLQVLTPEQQTKLAALKKERQTAHGAHQQP